MEIMNIESEIKNYYEDAFCCHLEHIGKKYIKNRYGVFYNKHYNF